MMAPGANLSAIIVDLSYLVKFHYWPLRTPDSLIHQHPRIPYITCNISTSKGVASMQIGVGLPTGVPGTNGRLVIEWAHRADEGPFSSLGVVDRLAYDSYEPLTALAVAAGVTRRVKLATTIVIGLLHNTAMLAKMSATLDAISGGRLVLGLAVGARAEDYIAAGI